MIGDNYKLILISLKIHLEKFHFFSTNEAGSNTNKNITWPLAIGNPPWKRKQSLWIPPKSNSNEIETYPWLKRTFFTTLVEKECHRIYQKMKRKR